MKVHHLNCATMCPFAGRLLGYQGHRKMVCHTLLIEAPDGLVLVDTGLGLADVSTPHKRLGSGFVLLSGPRLDPAETAHAQVRALGFSPNDVRHVVVTHLDLDHIGGARDFPNARLHVHARELSAARERSTLRERHRYRTAQLDFPDPVTYTEAGDRWMGFDAVRGAEGLCDDVLLIPLHGHTRGHCAVAVQDDSGWLLHAGDAYFHHQELAEGHAPFILEQFQKILQMDGPARLRNRARLRDLQATSGPSTVRIFSAHDPVEFERFH